MIARMPTGCGRPLGDAAVSWREELVFAEAAVLVRLEVFVRRHALHQPAHGAPGWLRGDPGDSLAFRKTHRQCLRRATVSAQDKIAYVKH